MAKSRLRILFIVNHFYPELGAIRTEFEITRELAKNNKVLVITTFPRSYRLPRNYKYVVPRFKPAVIEWINGLKVLRIKSFKSKIDEFRQRFIELLTSFIMLFVASFFLAPYYDVLLVAGDIELVVAQIGILLKFFWKKPVVVILHDIHPDTLVRSGVIKKTSIVVRLSEVMIRIFSRYVDRVVVHSNTNAWILSKRYSMPLERINIVELWANIEDIEPTISPEEKDLLKRKYAETSNNFLVSFAGVMNPPQGLDVVIYAAKWIKDHFEKEYEKMKFLLVGDGMDKPRLMTLAESLNVKDIVKFLPLQPRNKYIEILKASDACLVTLRKDYIQPVVPSKLLEIMAAGCPAVLSMPRHSDAVRIVEKYKCGIYAGNGDPEELAQALLKLMHNPELAHLLGNNGRLAAERYYNLGRAVKQYQDILLRVVKN